MERSFVIEEDITQLLYEVTDAYEKEIKRLKEVINILEVEIQTLKKNN